MIGEYTVVEWIQYISKKWWKILIVIVLASFMMGVPKTLKSNSVSSNINLHIVEKSTKNYILGGILGGIFMVFIYSVIFLVSKKVLSKKLLESRFYTDSISAGKNGLAYEILCYSVHQAKRCGKKLIVLSSTLEDKTFFGEVLAEFSRLGYSVLCADFSNSLECSTDENIKLLDKNTVEEMKKPGRFVEPLSDIGSEFEYLVFYSPLVSNDRAALERFENSACSIFVENLGVSSKYPLENTLAIIRKNAPELPICLAWKK